MSIGNDVTFIFKYIQDWLGTWIVGHVQWLIKPDRNRVIGSDKLPSLLRIGLDGELKSSISM